MVIDKGLSALKSLKTGKRRKSSRKVLLSIVSFVLTSVLMISMTFSWFSIKTSELEAIDFKLDCGKGLRVNDTGTSQLSFAETNKNLIPASSVDGRNLFFPTDGSDFSSVTANMTFRSANAGDKNENYIQIDFSLTAQQNHTALYINEEETSIRVAEPKPEGESHGESDWSIPLAACLRSALWSSTAEQGVPNTPIVFNPTASTLYTAAVEDVDRSTGAFISSGRQVAHAFSEYSFGGTPVATLDRGVETKFSYIVWLEGTDPKCVDRIVNKDIQIKLAFSTSWDKTQTIRFQDNTTGNSIKSKLDSNDYTLTLRYDELDSQGQSRGTPMDFNMYAYRLDDSNNKVWTCNIPGDMRKNIWFILRPKGDSGQVYEFRYNTAGGSTMDRGANRLYIADDLNQVSGQSFYGHGHWVPVGDSDGAGHDSGGGFEGDDF